MRKSNWTIYSKRADFKAIAETFGIDQVTARVMRNRDVIGDEQIRKFLSGDAKDLYNPALLKDADKAVSILREKIRGGKKIRIIGDYDIDGVCATAILYEVLTLLGADVDYEIPDRVVDGFGLKERLVRFAIDEQVDTILTCDNGISAVTAVDLAKENGLTVIITDHHQPGEQLPRADAVVDPCQADDPYPMDGICGAVVAWKLMQLLTGSSLMEYIDLAAFATVGDIMKLQDENRIIVRLGLEKLANTERIGLRALIRENGLTGKKLQAWQIGFILGPCINAGGRIDTAKRSLQLLLTRDEQEAETLAKDLVSLNVTRREMTTQGLEQAITLLEHPPLGKNGSLPEQSAAGQSAVGDPSVEQAVANTDLFYETYSTMEDRVLVVYLPDCHESVAGIIAGKIRERYYKPALVLTNAHEEGMVKGSGRSIEGYHMFRELTACDDLLVNYGGHPMAAGFSLKKDDLAAFARRLNENCTLTSEQLLEKRMIDMRLPMYYLTEGLIEELSLLEPFGNGNEKPVFGLKGVTISDGMIRGAQHNTFTCMITDETGKSLKGIWFGDTKELIKGFWEKWGMDKTRALMKGQACDIKASILYEPQINEYRGWKSIQLRIVDIM